MNKLLRTLYIFLIYFLPIVALTTFGIKELSEHIAWRFFSYGLVISFCGSTLLFILLQDRQVTPAPQIPIETPPAPIDNSPEIDALKSSLLEEQTKHTHAQDLITSLTRDNSDLSMQIDLKVKELNTYRQAAEKEMQFKESKVREWQLLVMEQRQLVEKQQHQISILQQKEQDLNGEIQTLLHLAVKESPTPYKVSEQKVPKTSESSTDDLHLKRYVDIAIKMTAAPYYSQDHMTLDLRRLFESLQDSSDHGVFVFSHKENRILFANERVKELLGWPTEKFVHHFSDLMTGGQEEWSNAISHLAANSQAHFSLPIKTKNNDVQNFKFALGMIHTGLFRHHAIGILSK